MYVLVPAMLEHDTIQGLSSSVKPAGLRGRSSSHDGEPEPTFTIEDLLKQVSISQINNDATIAHQQTSHTGPRSADVMRMVGNRLDL